MTTAYQSLNDIKDHLTFITVIQKLNWKTVRGKGCFFPRCLFFVSFFGQAKKEKERLTPPPYHRSRQNDLVGLASGLAQSLSNREE